MKAIYQKPDVQVLNLNTSHVLMQSGGDSPTEAFDPIIDFGDWEPLFF